MRSDIHGGVSVSILVVMSKVVLLEFNGCRFESEPEVVLVMKVVNNVHCSHRVTVGDERVYLYIDEFDDYESSVEMRRLKVYNEIDCECGAVVQSAPVMAIEANIYLQFIEEA